MPSGCCIRALWVINNQDSVVFSRKFPVVEKRWRLACGKEIGYASYRMLPNDSQLAASFIERRKREGSARGTGLRLCGSSEGSDSWVDDPITRHVISLSISGEENGDDSVLRPLVLNVKGPYSVLVLPLVEPCHLETYSRMCNTHDCGSVVGADESMASLLLELPSITGAFAIAHTIGDVVLGDSVEPEVIISTTSSVGGLLDSLTGGIPGISSRTKPATAPAAASAASGTALRGSVMSEAIGSRSFDKD